MGAIQQEGGKARKTTRVRRGESRTDQRDVNKKSLGKKQGRIAKKPDKHTKEGDGSK